MKETITRTIKLTKVDYAVVLVEQGEPLFDKGTTYLNGTYTSEQAKKKLEKQSGNQYTILSLDSISKTYEMPLDDFIQNATEINKGEK